MSCCGQNRQDWRQWAAQRSLLEQADSVKPALLNPKTIYHLGDTSLVMTGAVTGNTYLFPPRGGDLEVDERDFVHLLSTGLFHFRKPEPRETSAAEA